MPKAQDIIGHTGAGVQESKILGHSKSVSYIPAMKPSLKGPDYTTVKNAEKMISNAENANHKGANKS